MTKQQFEDKGFRSLSFRIGLAIIAAEIAVTLVLGIAVLYRISDQAEQNVRTRLMTTGNLFRRGLLDYDALSDGTLMSELIGEPVTLSLLVDVNGTIHHASDHRYIGRGINEIEGLDPKWFGMPSTEIRITESKSDSGYWLAVSPLMGIQGDTSILFSFVKVSRAGLRSALWGAALQVAVSCLAVVLITTAIILVSFHRIIATRLSYLVSLVRRVERGHLDPPELQAPPARDEIGVLQTGIDHMIRSLRASVNELKRNLEELKAAQRAQSHSERQLQTVLDTSPAVVFIKDVEGKYLFVNRQFLQIFGFELSSVLGRSDLELLDRKTAESVRTNDRIVLETREPLEIEELIPQRDGLHTYASVKFCLADENGSPYAICGIATDVTERQREREALRDSNEQLRQFAYAAAHDLQEPARNIRIYSELLERQVRDRLDADQQECLEIISEGARRMQEMVRDLLAYSRIVKKAEGEPPTTDANLALADVMANLQLAIADSSAIVTAAGLPKVGMPRVHLQQVLQNLLENAIKYRSSDPPRINISAHRSGKGWCFCVSDNGIGIAPDYHEQIFEVFKRLHGRTHAGTGIGLALCKRIVEHWRGKIWVESQAGCGSRFFFTVPDAGLLNDGDSETTRKGLDHRGQSERHPFNDRVPQTGARQLRGADL